MPPNAAILARNDPQALWPDLALDAYARAHALIARVARAVLAGQRPHLVAGDAAASRAMGIAAFVTGMGPLLGHWTQSGAVTADPAVAALLGRHLEHGRRRSERLREHLFHILDAFETRGLQPVVLKGMHTACDYFPAPGTRPVSDIDLLIAPEELREASAALDEAGLVACRQLSPHGRHVWIPGGRPQAIQSLELTHVDNPWSVDLHTTLKREYCRGLRVGFGNEASQAFQVAGRSVRGLAQPWLTGFLSQHASENPSGLQLVRLVELIQVIRHDAEHGRLTWSKLQDLTARSRTALFVYPAFELAERFAPGTVDPVFRRHITAAAPARLRRLIRRVDVDAPVTPTSVEEKLIWAAGPLQLALCLSTLLWPAGDDAPFRLRLRIQLRRLGELMTGRTGLRARR